MKTPLTLLIAAATAAGCGGAAQSTGPGGGADRAPAAHRAPGAPPSTVVLSRAARVHGVPLRIDVALLRRAGRTATLDLRLRSMAPHGNRSYVVATDFSAGCCTTDVSGIYLMDPATGRQLPPLRRDEQCVCTRGGYGIEIAPGGTAMLTAAFPAPAPNATTADVIVPHFGAFRDVPLRP